MKFESSTKYNLGYGLNLQIGGHNGDEIIFSIFMGFVNFWIIFNTKRIKLESEYGFNIDGRRLRLYYGKLLDDNSLGYDDRCLRGAYKSIKLR